MLFALICSVIMSKWGFDVDSKNAKILQIRRAIRCVRPTDKAHHPNIAAAATVAVYFSPFPSF